MPRFDVQATFGRDLLGRQFDPGGGRRPVVARPRGRSGAPGDGGHCVNRAIAMGGRIPRCYTAYPVPGSGPALTDRQRQILYAVCRGYVASGEPVSSRRLVEAHGFCWSSATLRGELAELERRGLLHQPHHSAGRLPTGVGLQQFVDGLARAPGPRPDLARAVDRTLQQVEDAPAARLRATTMVLSEASDCVALSLVGRESSTTTRHLEVVPLVEGRALVVLGMDDGTTRVRPVAVGNDPLARDPADSLRAKLRWLFVGRTIGQARRRLVDLLREEEERVDRMLGQALRVGLSLCAAESLQPSRVEVAGQPRLARHLAGAQAGRLAPILELLEDYHRLAEVLGRLLPGAGLEARVCVGGPGGEPRPGPDAAVAALRGLSLVGCRLGALPRGGETGAIALLGPDRMDFAALIPLVEYAARALTTPPE